MVEYIRKFAKVLDLDTFVCEWFRFHTKQPNQLSFKARAIYMMETVFLREWQQEYERAIKTTEIGSIHRSKIHAMNYKYMEEVVGLVQPI